MVGTAWIPIVFATISLTWGCSKSANTNTDDAGSTPDSESVAGADLDTDGDTDTDTDADTDTDTDTDAGTDTETDRDTNSQNLERIEVADAECLPDPYGRAPLSAIIKITHPSLVPENVTRVRVSVASQSKGIPDLVAELDPQSDAYKTYFDMSDKLSAEEVGIPVLGLYPSTDNQVSFLVSDGAREFAGRVSIVVGALAEEAESVTVSVADDDRMEPGLTYVNNRVYDKAGRLRWRGPTIYRILKNGNILSDVDEFNWLGKIVTDRTLPEGLESHLHDSIALPNGDIVACVSSDSTTIINSDGDTVASSQDYLVELDDESNIQNAWDLREYLDVTRETVASNSKRDWVHVNTLAYDETDDTLLVSARFQGIVKLTRGGVQGPTPNVEKALVWIAGPRMGWGLAGWNGEGPIDPNAYLLWAVDGNGTHYPEEVQKNLAAPNTSSDEFYWPVGQHGIHITSREPGKISFLIFNNQASFLFDGEDSTYNGVTFTTQGDLSNDRSIVPYSQIIEYEVDEINMTIRRLWSYGENQTNLYGSFNSGVNLMTETKNRMMLTSGVDQHDPDGMAYHPHVVEITQEGEVVFHLEIENTNMSADRSGRIDLFHPEHP